MTGTIKKRALSLLMALTMLLSAFAVFDTVGLKAQAASDCTTLQNRQITNTEIEAAIAWASKLADAHATGWNSKSYNKWTTSYYNCTVFVSDAFYDGAGLPRQSVQAAPHFLNKERGHKIYQGEPPRGAIALYTGGSEGWGHMAISLGNGKVVEGGNGQVQYNNLSLTNYVSTSKYTYMGYMWYGDMLPPATKTSTTTQTKLESYFAPASISGSGSLALLATSVNMLKGTQYTEADIRKLNTNNSTSAYWSVLESKLGIQDHVSKVGSMSQSSKISHIASLAKNAAGGVIVQINSTNADGTRYILCIGSSGSDLLVLDPFSKTYSPITLTKYCQNKGLTYSVTLNRIQTVWYYTSK